MRSARQAGELLDDGFSVRCFGSVLLSLCLSVLYSNMRNDAQGEGRGFCLGWDVNRSATRVTAFPDAEAVRGASVACVRMVDRLSDISVRVR